MAVPQDVRWGRAYEGYGEDPASCRELGEAFIDGSPGRRPDARRPRRPRPPSTSSATAGRRGAPRRRPATRSTRASPTSTRRRSARSTSPPYEAAIDAGARIVMASFSSTGAGKVHGDHHLLTEVLKGELGFTGFVVSDWAGVDQVDARLRPRRSPRRSRPASTWSWSRPTARASRRRSRPGSAPARSTQARIDDAVTRILTVKFEMGLFEHPMPPEDGRPASAPTRTARSRARRSASRRCCSRPTAGLLPLRDRRRRPARGLRRRRHRASSRAAGRSRGRARPGRPRRARPSPTTCAPGSATASSYTRRPRDPRGHATRRPASSSSPSRRTPRAWATRRRSRSPTADLATIDAVRPMVDRLSS